MFSKYHLYIHIPIHSYICIHIYICIYIYVYLHTYIYTCMSYQNCSAAHIYINICVYIHIHTYINEFHIKLARLLIHMSIYTYKYSYTCILYQTCSVAHMHAAYIYVCTFVYAHIHMYVNVQPIAFGVIFFFNLQSYSPWSLFQRNVAKET